MSDAPRPVKLLLDENLSPWVAEQLRGDGIDAAHIRDRKGLGVFDHEVLQRAYEEDRVLVTSDVEDFENLCAKTDVHAGLVVITTGNLLRAEQLALLRRIVELLSAEPDMVNRVLELDADGHHNFRSLPD